MRLKLISTFLILFSVSILHGQNSKGGSWQLGYYGDNLTHPGLKISKEYLIKNWAKTKEKIRGTKSSNRTYAFSPEFVLYWHRNNHYGLALLPSVNYQRTRATGGFFELRLGTGYHRSFLDGTTYRVNPTGDVERVPLAGQSTWINALTWSFGKDLRLTKQVPLRYYVSVGTSFRTPYNHHWLPAVNLGFGIHYFLKQKDTVNE